MLDLKQSMLPLRAFILFSYLSKYSLQLWCFSAMLPTLQPSMKHPSARSVPDEHLRAVARIKSELAPHTPLPRRHRWRCCTCVPASTRWRAVPHISDPARRAVAGGKPLQLVHLRRVVRRLCRACVHRVGREQQGMGPWVCCALLGMLIWIAGFLFYRNQLPDGRNPITRIL
jgi:hypothetical protein